MTETVTLEEIAFELQALYRKHPRPRADEVQLILDRIAAVDDERLREILFVTAKQNLRGALQDLVVSTRVRILRAKGLLDK